MNILVVEDEKRVAEFLQKGLSESGYRVDVAFDGEAGLEQAGQVGYDLFILDWLLPGKNGLELCRELRSSFPATPILMLTAKDTLQDKILGLDTGADDYLTKPFSFEELKARVRALARRKKRIEPRNLSAGDLEVNPADRSVTRGGVSITLSNKEYELLTYLLRNKNKVLSRELTAREVWGITFDTGTNYIDVYINYLRKKLKVGSEKPLIFTIRGRGYILKDEDDHPDH